LDFNAKTVKNALIRWIRDYFADTEAAAVIGISGGKDSTIAAALCADALGSSRVVGVLMPQGVQEDIDVSYAVCEFLGIRKIEINIDIAVQSLYNAIPADIERNDILLFNTPARIRMATLYAVSAGIGGRVVNTCNLSEAYVGWGTKFGDIAGDFSPLSNLTVTEVKAIGQELSLPDEFINKIPIDGLCGKTDEDGLGFSYDALDLFIRHGICEQPEILARIKTLHDASAHKREPIPRFQP
jgi:NAD+ synthase